MTTSLHDDEAASAVTAAEISNLLDCHAPLLEDEVREYLSSYLTEHILNFAGTTRNDNEDKDFEDGIVQVLEQFLADYKDSEAVVSKLVPSLIQYADSRSSEKDNIQPEGSSSMSSSSMVQFKICLNSDENKANRNHSESNGTGYQSDGRGDADQRNQTSQAKKSKRSSRKETRQQRRNHKHPPGKKNNSSNDSKEVTNKCNGLDPSNGEQHEETVDDHDSSWKECQEQGISWGGRGHGGRGIRPTQNMEAIHLPSVSLTFAGNDLLTDSPMNIVKGHRYGLIGRNGVGKSTLLSKLAKSAIPGLPLGMRILLVHQQIDGSDVESALDVLVKADVDRLELLREKDEMEKKLEAGEDLEATAERLGSIFEELEVIDADGAEKRALDILKGLSFTKSMIYGPTANLSGGWRMRLALARALFVPNSDLILFDECTNHLDLHGLDWLVRFIQSSNHTMIVVSHDRSFLDGICTDIIVMEHQRLNYYVGNYSEYHRQIQDKAARESHVLDAAERQRAKAEAFVQKHQAQANKKSADPNKQRQAKMIREKKMERIGNYREDGKRYKLNSLKKLDSKSVRLAQKVVIELDEPVLKIKFPNPTWPPGVGDGAPLVKFEDVGFRYKVQATDGDDKASKPLLSNMTLSLCRGDKVALVGRNGAGKSTLLRLITGEGCHDGIVTGNIWRYGGLRIGHVTQYSVEELEAFSHQTVVEYAEEKLASGKASASIVTGASGNIRQYLGGFGLGGSHALRHIGKLSGGERMRLCFATVLADEPQLLVLDEATNHVDLETLDSLAEALQAYQGVVIMVSHNQAFLSVFCKALWVLDDSTGHVTVNHSDTQSFDDIFSEYRSHILSSVVGAAGRTQQRREKADMAKRATKQNTGARTNTSLMS